jgi:two-component system, cell cycle sensor histidine kinase and response regulator CckA
MDDGAESTRLSGPADGSGANQSSPDALLAGLVAELAGEVVYRLRLDPTPHFEYISPSIVRFGGCTPVQVYDDPDVLLGRVHPDDRAESWSLLTAAPGRPPCLVVRWCHPDGTVRRVELRSTLHVDPAGGSSYVDAVARDITAQHDAEEALRTSEERACSILDQAFDGILVSDSSDRYVEANPAICRMLGYSKEEILSRHTGELIADDDPTGPEDLTAILADLHANRSLLVERRYRRSDGTSLPVELGLSLMPDGRLQRIVRDVSERKRADAAVRRLMERLEALVDASPLPIAAIASDGMVVGWNPACERVFGWAASEVVGKPYPLVDDHSRAEFEANVGRALTGDPLQGLDARRVRRDGSPIDVRMWSVTWSGEARERGIWVIYEDLTECRRAEAAIAASERNLRSVIEGAADGIAVLDAGGRITLANSRWCDLLGYTNAEILGLHILETYLPEERAIGRERLREMQAHPQRLQHARRMGRHDGTAFPAEMSAAPIADGRYQVIARDVSERDRLEAQLRQAHKMEAIGQLAGGISHDFNNLLTAIGGFAELLLADLPDADPRREDVLQIAHAADQGAKLTRQLLAFSRRQPVHTEPLDLAEVVALALPMLGRLVGEDVEIVVDLKPELPFVLADRAQLQQVLLNLAANARDAMPEGGVLRLAAAAVRLDAKFVRTHPGAQTGRHVRLSVSDTGLGMDEATQLHLFEPFFTTKEEGKGTGLGLASVYGIVKQANGAIYAESSLGQGTTFTIYLPAIQGTAAEGPAGPSVEAQGGGTETILLVEDEAGVRAFAQRTLEQLGYRVVAFATPGEAIALARQQAHAFDALVTDVVMPQVSGPALADQLRELRPGLPVLLMSGHDAGRLRGRPEPWLAKPFAGPELARAVGALFGREP